MGRVNPETVVTRELRRRLEALGAHTVKLSDSFTRGVPDLMVASDRVVMAELKVDESDGTWSVRTYRQLGMSGAQDQRVRELCRRNRLSACCVAIPRDMYSATLWVPLAPDRQGEGYESYRVEAQGWEGVLAWLMGQAYRRT